MRKCIVDDCLKPAAQRMRYCPMHAARLYRRGSLELPTGEGRFWAKIDRSGGPDACWPWMHAKFRKGYGNIGTKEGNQGAHRVAYNFAHPDDPLGPNDLCLHHCDNPPCCNPAHLFKGTKADNSQDMVRKGRHPLFHKTHCRNGHAITGDNVRIKNGSRMCKLCYNANARAWYAGRHSH